ncbi:MAG: hypothetical protein KY468_11770 [Armatimonadetes bacterium]|nr:hypothetical protein [Armatimonadota bacterium]
MNSLPLSVLLFDPEEGIVVREPPGQGEGWWAGAPGAFYDKQSRRFCLTYRYRRPRGVDPDRGGEFLIAESEDGVTFRDLWRLTKDQLPSPSIERGCLRRAGDGRWHLWISSVDPEDQRWRIDVMEADAPDGFEVSLRRKVFTAGDLGIEGIKDPWVFDEGPAQWMVVSFAERAPGAEDASAHDLHHHADAYDTGLILSHSGLAVRMEGHEWQWLGTVLPARRPEMDWDGYSARIACVMRTGSLYTAYYDGAIGVRNHYDEQTALAVSHDLRSWTRLSPDGPVLKSPHGTGCCRYFDAVEAEGMRYIYYEYARPDGSHELRVIRRPL